MKTQLPNGCSVSELSVSPSNWNTKAAKTTIEWVISYRFYDPNYEKPKQILLRGMNHFKTVEERRHETVKLIEEEQRKLKDGYNPFRKLVVSQERTVVSHERTNEVLFLLPALQVAFQNVTVSERTRRDLKYLLSQCQSGIASVGLKDLPIGNISRKHIKALLEAISNTPDRFNKNRSNLMILFAEMCEAEVLDINFPKEIKKKKCLKRSRTVLSIDERKLVDDHLRNSHPEFHRFLNIFFHSGARISELLRMRKEDVDLGNQRFKVIVQKGIQYREVWKTIKDVALPYWAEIYNSAGENDVVFSKGLRPGKQNIQPYQIGKRWYRLIKKRLGINADFYSLKHLHTTEVTEYLSDEEAAKHNSHTSTSMVKTIYDVRRREREQNQIKGLNNPFV